MLRDQHIIVCSAAVLDNAPDLPTEVAAFVEREGYRAGQCVDDNSIHHLGVISGGFIKLAVILKVDDIFHGASIGRVDPCLIGGCLR